MKKRTKDDKDLLPSLVQAAHAAGKVLMKYHRTGFQVREKIGAGLVTEADLAAEAKAVSILRRARPEFGFLTEEADPVEARSPGRFIIDPLDGTTNFVHGFPMFCVSIAAEWKGKLAAACIYHPVLKETYTATRGGGAFLNGKIRLQVSQTREIRSSLLSTGFAASKEQHLKKEMVAFERVSGVARAVRRPGSAALDLAYVARGVFDGFWERRLSPWDVAAGVLLVQEAGGRVTDFSGRPFELSMTELLATNRKLHPSLLKAMR